MNDVFTPQQREQIRAELVAGAKADSRITAAALLGSAALGLEDRWSDIDLALALAVNVDFNRVLLDWTTRLYGDHAAVAHYDVRRGEILYRVFLLANTLQIDLSFWPAAQLRAVGPKFKLIFGAAGDPLPAPVPDSTDLIGMAWLYALHVRSSVARSRVLQAEYMLSGMRDNVLALMCKRQGVSAVQGRGLDDLLAEQQRRATECLARSLDPAELKRAFRVTTTALLEELRCSDPALATQLQNPLNNIVNSLDVS
jgi:predicted nucleotidyltransferase